MARISYLVSFQHKVKISPVTWTKDLFSGKIGLPAIWSLRNFPSSLTLTDPIHLVKSVVGNEKEQHCFFQKKKKSFCSFYLTQFEANHCAVHMSRAVLKLFLNSHFKIICYLQHELTYIALLHLWPSVSLLYDIHRARQVSYAL